jgi:thiamine-monophosphate kinase
MIDISDGLLADLGHIMEESHVGACVWVDQVPRSKAFDRLAHLYHPHPMDLVLAGGEDYELLFTAPKEGLVDAFSQCEGLDLPIDPIGRVTAHPEKLSLLRKDKSPYSPAYFGHDHFRGFAPRG